MADTFTGADTFAGTGTTPPWDHHGLDRFDPAAVATWVDSIDPTEDLDGDGTPETVVLDDLPHAFVVATDSDRDDTVDRLTAIADNGEFGVWEFRRDLDGAGRWDRIDAGTLGDDGNHDRRGE